jgi:hypothetical protein
MEFKKKIEIIKQNLKIIKKRKLTSFFKLYSSSLAGEWTLFCALDPLSDVLLKFFFKDYFLKISTTDSVFFLWCLIIVVVMSLIGCIAYLYEPWFVEFTILNKKTTLRIEFGNIWEKNIIAIGVNNFFDTCLKYDVIKPSSLHGQLIQNVLGGDCSDFDNAISQLRVKPTPVPNRKDTPDNDLQNKKNKYDIGTTAIFKHDEKTYACTVISEMPYNSFSAESSSEKIFIATKKMLNEVRGICGNEEIALPIWGTGLARCCLDEKQMIEVLLAAIMETSNDLIVSKKITIVIYKPLYGTINLEELKKKWGENGVS